MLIFWGMKIDIHAAFWRAGVPKIVRSGGNFPSRVLLRSWMNLVRVLNVKAFWASGLRMAMFSPSLAQNLFKVSQAAFPPFT